MRHTLWFSLFLVIAGCDSPRAGKLELSAHSDRAPEEFSSETSRHFHVFRRDQLDEQEAGASAAPLTYSVEKYSLEGRFDWATQVFHGEVTIDLKVEEKATTIALDSLVGKVHSVKLASGANLSYDLVPGKIRIALPHLDVRSDTQKAITIVVSYETHANTGIERALIATPHRKGDPIKGRIAATFSEPIGVPEWMPCHNVPTDRALFSSRFTLPEAERVIANGDLVSDEVKDGVRTMAYQTSYTLPTYLMAFALGDFQVETDTNGRVPLQIWHRSGLAVDTAGMFKELRRFIGVFEGLLVPYPFEKYALVLLPAYTSGLEHAGITFQGETRSSHARVAHDLELSAHELAHQWFGDLVTVATWDDLWIKEGMATLLAQEALRPYEDENNSGRLLVKDFTIKTGEAVRDPRLAPNDKYTTGPYGRGAWVYSQIRSILGEKSFWGVLTGLMKKYKFGAIGTDELLAEFKDELGEENLAKLKKALVAKTLPAFEKITVTKDRLSLKFKDTQGSMIAPLTLTYMATDGTVTEYTVTAKETLDIPLSDGGMLLFDAPDRHPWFDFVAREDMLTLLSPLMIPQTAEAKQKFTELAAHHQTDALWLRKGWKLDARTFGPFYGKLNSELARYRALQLGCDLAKGTAEWKTALEPILKNPPQLGLQDPTASEGLSSCRSAMGDDFFAASWAQLIGSSVGGGYLEPELLLLTLVSTSADVAFDNAKTLIARGATVRTQRMMTQLMRRHWGGKGKYKKPKDGALWTAWVRDFITTSEVEETLEEALDILADAKDKEALPILARMLPTATSPILQKEFFCTAYKITANGKSGWPGFVKELGDPAQLSDRIRALITEPKACLKEEQT